VEALVSATAQVLVAVGYAKLTTTEVARVAGTSIGSLYQYFPAKEALVVAVLERHLEELYRSMERGLAEAGPSIEERIEGVLRGLLEAKARDPALSAALRSQLPRIEGYARVAQLLRRVEQLVAGLLAAHRKEAARIDPAWTAMVLTAGVDGVISSVLERDPARLRDPRLLRELCRMVLGYLRAG
jgi:AcrR family transcriptional regulator